MTDIIRHRRVEPDRWTYATPDAVSVLPAGPLVVPLAAWKARRTELASRRDLIGLRLEPGDDPAEIAADLGRFVLVAVHFPKFTDGRGYSTATLLRRRHDYRGELRAFGDLGRDQLFYLARVGFDSFQLADRHDPHAALSAFDDFTVRYQGAVDVTAPLYRREERRA